MGLTNGNLACQNFDELTGKFGDKKCYTQIGHSDVQLRLFTKNSKSCILKSSHHHHRMYHLNTIDKIQIYTHIVIMMSSSIKFLHLKSLQSESTMKGLFLFLMKRILINIGIAPQTTKIASISTLHQLGFFFC